MANLMEILESSLFLWGLAFGGLCLTVITALRSRIQRPLPIGGLLISVASVVAFALGGEFSVAPWLALVTVFVLTAVAGLTGGSGRAVALASLPGAALMALAVPDEPVWLRLVVLASVPVVGYLLDEFESRYRSHGLGMVFFCLAVAGTFLAVPDTELARAMVAVSFPMVFLAWPRTLVSIGRSGGYMAGAVFAMATTAGGVGREASVIGGMACLGFLMLEPLAVRRRPRLVALPASLHRTPEAAVLASVPQAAMVYFASRVAGPLSSIPVALTLVVALFGAGYLMLIWVERNRVPESDDEG